MFPLPRIQARQSASIKLALCSLLIVGASGAHANTHPDKRVLWEYKTGAEIWSPLSSQGDALYFGNDDGKFFALDTRQHKLKWQYKSGGRVRSATAFYGDMLIFSSDDGYMYVLNKNTGKLAWKFDLGDGSLHRKHPMSVKDTEYEYDYLKSSPVIDGHTVYIGSGDGQLYAIDLDKQKLQWKFASKEKIRASALVVQDKVCVGSWDHNFYCVNKLTGKELWHYDSKGVIQASASYTDGKIVFGGRTPSLFALDVNTGKEVWVTAYTDGSWVESSAVSDAGKLYVGSSDSFKLSAFDANNGKEIWQFKTMGWSWMSPLLADGVLYIGAIAAEPYYMPKIKLEAGFFAVDAASGKLLWKHEASKLNGPYITGGFFARPIVTRDAVWLADLDGSIRALKK